MSIFTPKPAPHTEPHTEFEQPRFDGQNDPVQDLPVTAEPRPEEQPLAPSTVESTKGLDQKVSRRGMLLGVGAGVVGVAAAGGLFAVFANKGGNSQPAPNQTPANTPSTSASPENTQEQDPLSSENLWAKSPEARLDLFRSLLPESMLSTPEKFAPTKMSITAALYNMDGNQAAYDAWSKARRANNQSGTNEEWADYMYGTVLEPAFTLLEGQTPTGEHQKGLWTVAARAGVIVMMQNDMNRSNGTPAKLTPYKYAYTIDSNTPNNVTPAGFGVTVKITDSDSISDGDLEKIKAFNGQNWKLNTKVGGTYTVNWVGVHYDSEKKIVLPSKTTDTA